MGPGERACHHLRPDPAKIDENRPNLTNPQIPPNPAHQLIGFCGHDGERLKPVAFLVLPGVPQAREGEGTTTQQFTSVGLLRWLSFLRVE